MKNAIVKVGDRLYSEKGDEITVTEEFLRSGKMAHSLVVEGASQIKNGACKMCLGLSEVRAGSYCLLSGVSTFHDYAENIVGISTQHAHRLASIGDNFSEEIINQLGVTKAGLLLALPVGDKEDLVQSAFFADAEGKRYTIEDMEYMTTDRLATLIRKHKTELGEKIALEKSLQREIEELKRHLSTAIDEGDDGKIKVLKEQLRKLTEDSAEKLADLQGIIKRNETRESVRKSIAHARNDIETGIAILRDILDHHESDEVIILEAHGVLQGLTDNLTTMKYHAG